MTALTTTPSASARAAVSPNGRPDPGPQMSDERMIHAYLRNRDVPCPCCGYNLRDLLAAECPECGARLTVHIGSGRVRLRGWLFALIALCLPLGFSITLSAVAGYGVLRRELWLENDATAIAILLVSDLILGALVFYLVRRREHWLTQSAAAQWVRGAAWAAGAFLLAFVLVAILGLALE